MIQSNTKRLTARRSPLAANRSCSRASSASYWSGATSLRSANITKLLSTPEAREVMSAMIQRTREADKEELVCRVMAELGQSHAAHSEEVSELRLHGARVRQERDTLEAQVRSSNSEGQVVTQRVRAYQQRIDEQQAQHRQMQQSMASAI